LCFAMRISPSPIFSGRLQWRRCCPGHSWFLKLFEFRKPSIYVWINLHFQWLDSLILKMRSEFALHSWLSHHVMSVRMVVIFLSSKHVSAARWMLSVTTDDRRNQKSTKREFNMRQAVHINAIKKAPTQTLYNQLGSVKQWYIFRSSSLDRIPANDVMKPRQYVSVCTSKSIAYLPPWCRKDVFRPLIPTPLDNFTSVRLPAGTESGRSAGVKDNRQDAPHLFR